MKLIRKVQVFSTRFFLKIISLINHRVYMRLLNRSLKALGVKLNGTPRYIGANVSFDNYSRITLGDRLVISDECHLLTHDYSLTTALISIHKKPNTDMAFDKEIVIGNNVFIGKKSIIMPGTVIGNNVIIGAGSVVRGKVEDDSIVIGNPAIKVGKLSEKAYEWENRIEKGNVKKD